MSGTTDQDSKSPEQETSGASSISSTFSLTAKNSYEQSKFEKFASLKKLLQKELNKSITVDECDAVLLAGALLVNDSNAVKEQSRLVRDMNIRLWGNAVDALSKWIVQHEVLPSTSVRTLHPFIEGNTPLHFAVLTGNFEHIAFLLAQQCDPCLKNAHGDKPLELYQAFHRRVRARGKKPKLKSKGAQVQVSPQPSPPEAPEPEHKQADAAQHDEHDDADDEDESDFDEHPPHAHARRTHDGDDDDDDCHSVSSSTSSSLTVSSMSESPMHLSNTDFDELFTHAVPQEGGDREQTHSHQKPSKTLTKDKHSHSSSNVNTKVSKPNSSGTNIANARAKSSNPSTKKLVKKNKPMQRSSNYFSKYHGKSGGKGNAKNRNKNKRVNPKKKSKQNNKKLHHKKSIAQQSQSQAQSAQQTSKSAALSNASLTSHATLCCDAITSTASAGAVAGHVQLSSLATQSVLEQNGGDSEGDSGAGTASSTCSSCFCSGCDCDTCSESNRYSEYSLLSDSTEESDSSSSALSDSEECPSSTDPKNLELEKPHTTEKGSCCFAKCKPLQSFHAVHDYLRDSLMFAVDALSDSCTDDEVFLDNETLRQHRRDADDSEVASDSFVSSESSSSSTDSDTESPVSAATKCDKEDGDDSDRDHANSHVLSVDDRVEQQQHFAISKLLTQTMEQNSDASKHDKNNHLLLDAVTLPDVNTAIASSSSSSTAAVAASPSSPLDSSTVLDTDGAGGDAKPVQQLDLHSQLVPIIVALSELNIFADCASLARVVKFLCTLIFFVALHYLEGNSTAKLIVKVSVSVVYLAAMFGHRLTEWKECIDAEAVLRKQQWTKQRDKERQKRKDRLQRTLRNPECKRSVAKKQRKLERDTCHKQDVLVWCSRIRVMINHAESAYLQRKWGTAEIYFSRLLSFLLENEKDAHLLLNEHKRSALKLTRRWRGVFDQHWTVPLAKIFSRRAHCLCRMPAQTQPRAAPTQSCSKNSASAKAGGADDNDKYKTMLGHVELAIRDLQIAVALREISSLYARFMALPGTTSVRDRRREMDVFPEPVENMQMQSMETQTGTQTAITKLETVGSVADSSLSALADDLPRLTAILNSQLCDLVSLSGLYDLRDDFETAYSCILHADHLIHCLNRFSQSNAVQHVTAAAPLLWSTETGFLKLSMADIVPLSHIQSQLPEPELQPPDEDDAEEAEVEASLPPLRESVDLTCYQQLQCDDDASDATRCGQTVQLAIDEQLKKIRLLRLQAANRQRVTGSKHERSNKSADGGGGGLEQKRRKLKKTKHELEKNKPKHQHGSKQQSDKQKLKQTKHENSRDALIRNDKNTDEEEHEEDVKNTTELGQEGEVDVADVMVQMSPPMEDEEEEDDDVHSKHAPPATPTSVASQTSLVSATSSACSEVSNSECGGDGGTSVSFSVIQSDKEDDDRHVSALLLSGNTRKPPLLRKNKSKLKKLKKRNQLKIGKKKSKKKHEQKKNGSLEDRASISSESPSVDPLDHHVDDAHDVEDSDEEDSLSTLSESTSPSADLHAKTQARNAKSSSSTTAKNAKKTFRTSQNHRQKHAHVHASSHTHNHTHARARQHRAHKHSPLKTSIHPQQQQQQQQQRKKSSQQQHEKEKEEEPRTHWLWNIECEFWPNCRNSHQCSFRHPSDKGSIVRRKRGTPKSGDGVGRPILCKFGRECSRVDCWFWHPDDQETFLDPANLQTHSPMAAAAAKQTAAVTAPTTALSVTTSSDRSNEFDGTGTEDGHSNHSGEKDVSTTKEKEKPAFGLELTLPRALSGEGGTGTGTGGDSATRPSSAVIISKKPISNPWNKKRRANSKSVAAASAAAGTCKQGTPRGSRARSQSMLSPMLINNQHVLSQHHQRKLSSRSANGVQNPPLSAGVTVGAAVGYHQHHAQEFDFGDYGDVQPQQRAQQSKQQQRHRKGQKVYMVKNRKKAKSRVQSNLNPNASAFEFTHFGSRPSRGHQQTPPMTAPVHAHNNSNNSFLGMHSHYGYNGDGNGNGREVSSPFDPHSQLHNGGVFDPHHAHVRSDYNNDNNNNNDTDNNSHDHTNNDSTHYTQNNNHAPHSKTSTTMKTTTTTTISTVTETINESTTYPAQFAQQQPPHSAHAHSRAYDEPWSADAYSFDEYKQAPTPQSQFNHHHQAYQHQFGDGDRDESKVMDEATTTSGGAAAAGRFISHRQRDDVDFRVDVQPKRDTTTLLRQWTCPSCSVLNKAGTNECELCSSTRPTLESDDTDFDEEDDDDDSGDDEEEEDDDMEHERRHREQRSPSFTLDFDFNAQEMLNAPTTTMAAAPVSPGEHSESVTFDANTHELQDLFFGTMSSHRGYQDDDDHRSLTASFSIGDRVLHHGAAATIQGTVVEIRDVTESPFPIKIEYFEDTESGEQSLTPKFLWVLPQELLKINANQADDYDEDILYDYEDDDGEEENDDDADSDEDEDEEDDDDADEEEEGEEL